MNKITLLVFLLFLHHNEILASQLIKVKIAGQKSIKVLNLENYIAGVVVSEMPSSWPSEALKAQAILARTYALKKKYQKINNKFHLHSTVLHQAYNGPDKTGKGKKATKETAGEILTYNNELANVFYHSTCGGRTEQSNNVWHLSSPYIKSIKCHHCKKSPKYAWKVKIGKKKLKSSLKDKINGSIRSISINKKNSSSRAQLIKIKSRSKTITIKAVELRKLLGYSVLPSTYINEIYKTRNDFYFVGNGFGHGVGLCQWGAKKLAQKGFTAEDILKYYFPGTKILKMY